MSRIVVTIVSGAVFGTLAGCVPAVAFFIFGALSGGSDAQSGLGIVFLAIIGAPIGIVAGAIAGAIRGANRPLKNGESLRADTRKLEKPSGGVAPVPVFQPGLKAAETVPFGSLLGIAAGCGPALALCIFCPTSVRNDPDFKFGLALVTELLIGVPPGIVAGLIGGAMCCAKQSLPTAAAPCVGLMAGGIIGATINPWYYIWLGPTAGGFAGIFYTILTWRRADETVPPPPNS